MRENVQFHDGTPLSAEAVRLWVERGKALPVSTISGDLDAVGSVEETDAMTAAFRMDRPFSPLLWILGDRAGMMASPAVYDDFTEANSRSAPSGAGAFRFVEEELDGPFVVEANPNYWLPNAPSIEGITWFQGALQTVGNVEGLLAGDYDIIFDATIEDFDRIRDAGFTLLRKSTNFMFFWNINTNLGPWGNPHARHAFNAGFDRIELNEIAYGGLHTPVEWGWLGPTTIYHDPDEKFWGLDPEAVRMHLAAGGLEDGFEFDMVVKAEDPLYVDPSLYAQASLAQFGITMNVVQKPSPDFWAGFYGEQDPAFMGGMSMRADIWQMLAWNLVAEGPHDHILPPDGDPEMQAALTKVTEHLRAGAADRGDAGGQPHRRITLLSDQDDPQHLDRRPRPRSRVHVLRGRQAALRAERYPLGDVARRPHPLHPLSIWTMERGNGGAGAGSPSPSPSGRGRG